MSRSERVAATQTAVRGPGHYSADRRWWWEETRRQWFRTVGLEQVEVVADDSRTRTWATALVSVLVPYGDVYVRFVARERGPALRGLHPRAVPGYVGAPFPAARVGLDDVKAQGAWLGIQRARLRELEELLEADGWEPTGCGLHWWSVRYSRPGIDRETPADAYDREAAGEPCPASGPARRAPRRAPGQRRA